MIKSITVTNYLGDKLKLDLARPELSGLVVTSITGLGPGAATINSTELATNDGALFNSARISSRNIVISLKYLDNGYNSIEDARQKTYKFFPIKKKLTLLIETDNRLAEIEGYVESNEPLIFSKSTGSDISILCPDPYLYSAKNSELNKLSLSNLNPMLEFPLCNNSLDENLLELSLIENSTIGVITYTGDSEVGVDITIYADGEAQAISIFNLSTREEMDLNVQLVAGDEVHISTVKGNKCINLVREGTTTNLLGYAGDALDWFQLRTGDNVFVYSAESGVNNLRIDIQYRVVYEGV